MSHPKEYSRFAQLYDRRWSHYIQNTLNKAIEYCSLSGDEDILDVACGTGELERRLFTNYPKLRITSCDISQNMLKVAKSKFSGYNNISFIECPADKIPLADESKDIIICCNSFHFFKRPEEVIKEWQRILRQQGRFFILDWCRDFWLCKALEFLKRRFDRSHHHIYTANELSSMLIAHNFKVQSYWWFKVSWFWGMMALRGQKFFE